MKVLILDTYYPRFLDKVYRAEPQLSEIKTGEEKMAAALAMPLGAARDAEIQLLHFFAEG